MGEENYGIQRYWQPRSAAPGGLTGPGGAADERSRAVLAPLGAFLSIFTGFSGPVAAFVVWLVYRERSPAVARHAMRSVVYQSIWLVALARRALSRLVGHLHFDGVRGGDIALARDGGPDARLLRPRPLQGLPGVQGRRRLRLPRLRLPLKGHLPPPSGRAGVGGV